MSRQVLFLPQTQREVPLRPLWKIKWQSSPIFCLPPPYRERLKDPKPFSKLLPLPSAQRARCRIPTTIKDRFALQLLVEEGVFLFLKRLQGKYSLKKKIQRVKRPPNCWIKNNSRLLPLKKKEIKGKKKTKKKNRGLLGNWGQRSRLLDEGQQQVFWEFQYQAWYQPNHPPWPISLVVAFQHANYSCGKSSDQTPPCFSLVLAFPAKLSVGVWYGYILQRSFFFFPSPFVT